LAFELLDLMRERRPRDAQAQRGAAEMLLIGDGHEIPEKTRFNLAHSVDAIERPRHATLMTCSLLITLY
jgi:hypothetical protein